MISYLADIKPIDPPKEEEQTELEIEGVVPIEMLHRKREGQKTEWHTAMARHPPPSPSIQTNTLYQLVHVKHLCQGQQHKVEKVEELARKALTRSSVQGCNAT